jgi:hypothetical protein
MRHLLAGIALLAGIVGPTHPLAAKVVKFEILRIGRRSKGALSARLAPTTGSSRALPSLCRRATRTMR